MRSFVEKWRLINEFHHVDVGNVLNQHTALYAQFQFPF